jgi:hypothetical protein
MFVLTRYSSNTYQAQIRDGRDGKYRKLASATCTMGQRCAAQAAVTKLHGASAAETVREVTEPAAIAVLIGSFSMNSPHPWRVWTFTIPAKQPDPELVELVLHRIKDKPAAL